MRLRRVAPAVVGLLAAAALHVGAQEERDRAGLPDLDRRLQDAAVVGDAALLERHLADDFVFTHFGGSQDGKAKWVDVARMTPRRFQRRAVSEQTVEAHEDVVLVLGRLDIRSLPSSQPGARETCYALRYLHVFAWREGRWMFLSHRTTQMIEESHPCRPGEA